MNKIDIIQLLNSYLQNIDEVTEEQLEILTLDVTRVIDSKITDSINRYKANTENNINSVERESLRLAFLGYPNDLNDKILEEYRPEITEEDIQKANELLIEGFERNKEVMTKSLVARFKKHFSKEFDLSFKYLKYIEEAQENEHQLVLLKVHAKDNISTNDIVTTVEQKYDKLSNYHHLVIIFEDSDDQYISWKTISEVSVYLENFKRENNFSAYNRKRNKRIAETKEFLRNHDLIEYNDSLDKAVDSFYESVAYGFQFIDLFITNDGKHKILVMQKVELDEDPVPCPSCFEKIVRGNSYPKILYKSFECTNPACPSRSKIGRGKRYDYFSCKRQFMLKRNDEEDYISEFISNNYRRDIIPPFTDENMKDLISLYSWAGDSVLIVNSNHHLGNEYLNRKINYEELVHSSIKKNLVEDLPIVKLLRVSHKCIAYQKIDENTKVTHKLIDEDIVVNGNSTKLMPFISQLFGIKQVGGAITSPPYYNAREYSQWPNLLTYFIDMLLNAKSVHKILKDNGTYIYNIGDVVGQDNIYISSNMSKRRQMLGFYTVIIFSIVGYQLQTNIIWDKGEVQSKRNSSENRYPGYLKPINAYEHNFVFMKNNEIEIAPTTVEKIETVKKINSKGENKLGHTAPFPIEIAELILPFVQDDKEYILDPFLGSGTTIIAANKNGKKAIGFELNSEYYELSINRIRDHRYKVEQLSLL